MPMPRMVTFSPVRPRVALGTVDSVGIGPSAMTARAEASAPTAPLEAAAFKKNRRLDPSGQPPLARSLMAHLSGLSGRTRSMPETRARARAPRYDEYCAETEAEMVNKDLTISVAAVPARQEADASGEARPLAMARSVDPANPWWFTWAARGAGRSPRGVREARPRSPACRSQRALRPPPARPSGPGPRLRSGQGAVQAGSRGQRTRRPVARPCRVWAGPRPSG